MMNDIHNSKLTLKECCVLIVEDLRRLTPPSFSRWAQYLIFNASFRITFWFRIGNYLRRKEDMKIISKILLLFVFAIHKHNQFLTGIQLPLDTRVGKGLAFPHFSCIVINPSAKIGDYCTIFHGVTIGSKRGENGGSPRIGNNCVIAAGAKIIGNCKIGDNVFIGANALVTKDVPDNAVVGGIPAKILNYEGPYNTNLYRNIY